MGKKIGFLILLCLLLFGVWFLFQQGGEEGLLDLPLFSSSQSTDPSPSEESPAPPPPADGSVAVQGPTPANLFEFTVTQEYLNYLLDKYSDSLSPLKSARVSIEGDRLRLTGEVYGRRAAEQLAVSPSVSLFFPEVAEYDIAACVTVEENTLSVRIQDLKIRSSPLLQSALFDDALLSELNSSLTFQLSRYLPKNYVLQSMIVSDGKIYVGFRIE